MLALLYSLTTLHFLERCNPLFYQLRYKPRSATKSEKLLLNTQTLVNLIG
jgi:hypothetical protein